MADQSGVLESMFVNKTSNIIGHRNIIVDGRVRRVAMIPKILTW